MRSFRWDRLVRKQKLKSAYSDVKNIPRRVLPHSVKQGIKKMLNMNPPVDNEPFADVRKTPGMIPSTTTLFGREFHYVDGPGFLFSYNEIFNKEIYKFSTEDPSPFIIDVGANLGLSVLYFKRLFPGARIVAFEPDPDIFNSLQKNCASFELQNVELFQKAVWKENGTVHFKKEGSLGGRLCISDFAEEDVTVPSCRLRDYLTSKVTFLKIDIEGAETDVLEDSADLLRNVDHLFVEYHSFCDREQSLHRLLRVIHDAGFRVHIHSYKPSPQPLFLREIRSGIDLVDMNLDIFCYRM
jgi:FkbM family methyltransferase